MRLNIEYKIMTSLAPDYDKLPPLHKLEVFEFALSQTDGQARNNSECFLLLYLWEDFYFLGYVAASPVWKPSFFLFFCTRVCILHVRAWRGCVFLFTTAVLQSLFLLELQSFFLQLLLVVAVF